MKKLTKPMKGSSEFKITQLKNMYVYKCKYEGQKSLACDFNQMADIMEDLHKL